MILRSLAVGIARALPRGVEQWVHGHRALDRLARQSFSALAGARQVAPIEAARSPA